MARIRTVKPEFFRHEGLQDLEIENPGKYPMLVFAGLWTLSDRSGRFEWRPRQIKLDVLPFIPFDMEETLNILMEAGFIKKYEVDGKHYGIIPSFGTHQRIDGKEGNSPERYPAPPEQTGTHLEHTENTPDTQERSQEKEKEKEKEKENKTALSEFEIFWKAYPKKTGSKKAAFDNWKKLNGDKPNIETILTAIKTQRLWRENAAGEFRPEWKDPERWIKGRMWEVEISEGQSSKTSPPPLIVSCPSCGGRVTRSDLTETGCVNCRAGIAV